MSAATPLNKKERERKEKRNSLPTVAVEPELSIPQVCFLKVD